MSYLIKETKTDGYYCGCYDYSEFGAPYYMSFGSDYDANWYYCLEHALKDIEYILKHETYWKPEELLICIIDNGIKELTIQQAKELINEPN